MTLDIRGSLKNTKINTNPYIIYEELFSNAIDSYLIRKDRETLSEGLRVTFRVEFYNRELFGNTLQFRIICTDNGAGLGDEQTKAFVTKDTSYKDDLQIEGIGWCKGSGRIQFFHYFSNLAIDSIFRARDEYTQRIVHIDGSLKELDETRFKTSVVKHAEVRTIVSLDTIKQDIYERLFANQNLRDMFSSESLKRHIMLTFLPRLVSLKSVLNDFQIRFQTEYEDKQDERVLTFDDLPALTDEKQVVISYRGNSSIKKPDGEVFYVQHYRLDKATYKIPHNVVALCAKASIVKEITKRYLKSRTLENNPINGFYHVILIGSNYLDRRVNEPRDGFNIPPHPHDTETFLHQLISLEEIEDALDDAVNNMLTPPDWDKEKILTGISEKYGVSADMIAQANVRIHFGDTEDAVVTRVLNAYQQKIIKETSEIFDIKQELLQLDPTSQDFREKVNDISWKYASSLKNIDMVSLSQLVVRRAAIIDILSVAVQKNLNVQKMNEGERRSDEKVIHSIFFPMGKDSLEIHDHDIWLLSEEYTYYDYIASDKALSKIMWDDGNLLFDSDIDEALEKLLRENYRSNTGKRPDIAIFNKEGSVIIIEFKAPGVNLDDHVPDLMEYAQLLAAKSRGKLKKFYGYLIGTTLNPNRIVNYQRFPSGKGWFSTADIREHSTGTRLGELYSELLFYDDITDRANKRLDVYKRRLNLDISRQ